MLLNVLNFIVLGPNVAHYEVVLQSMQEHDQD